MKGTESSKKLIGGMTNKPIITCAGDWNLFCTLEAPLVAAIPQDSSEWKRSYGRVIKAVYVEATFVKFDKECLAVNNDRNLLKRPILHMYWTDCVDIESYKTTLRDDIESWLKILQEKDITDWMIVLVETYDIRKTNKLIPRTTVMDKIKSEFASKQEDRCVSIINPIKSESRSAESWRGLVSRIRHFVLISYNKGLMKFEEHMREQREKRNEPDWDFSKYFILQEQLAFVLEMLGLYEEALVQYDELDALFTQFILNSNVTESPKWLSTFQQPIESWHCVKLSPLIPMQLRARIVERKASLLEFRSYLFQRQCTMLLLTFKPWEIASRCLSMVHNTIKELSILDISVPLGATACWALLVCLESLSTCDRLLSNSNNVSHTVMEQCATQRAPLWHYAKDKLYELGKLCGLLPGRPEPSSEQLHLVVMLSASMGDSIETQGKPTPTDRLKEALGSKKSFQTHYLELAELAMGTYKHVGRLRFARLIGRELAAFYSDLGEMSKAVAFLLDALRSYEEQGWRDLAAQTRLELVSCFSKMGDAERYTKLSAAIASCPELEILVRNFYFDEMIKSIKNALSKSEKKAILCELNDCFRIISASVQQNECETFTINDEIKCCLQIESLLPREVICTRFLVSIVDVVSKEQGDAKKVTPKTPLKTNKTDLSVNSKNAGAGVASENGSSAKYPTGNSQKVMDAEPDGANFTTAVVTFLRLEDLKPKNPLLNPLHITSQLHYKEDQTLDHASVHCGNPKATLRRSESAKYRKPSATIRTDFTNCIKTEMCSLKPGLNEVVLSYVASKSGVFKLGQISVLVEGKLEFLTNALNVAKVGFEVLRQSHSVVLNKKYPKRDLIAGLEHAMELVITSGSLPIPENSMIHMKSSSGLSLCNVHGSSSRELVVAVPHCLPFCCVRVSVVLIAQLQHKRDDKSIEHKVWLQCSWSPEHPIVVPLDFSPPLTATKRLLTAVPGTSKLMQVTVAGPRSPDMSLALSNASLTCHSTPLVTLVDLNPKNEGAETILDSSGTNISFIWELQHHDPLAQNNPLKTSFSVLYRPLDTDEPLREYKCPFEIQDFATLFVIRTKLEPTKGSEFCRASQMCHLQLTIQRVNETEYTSVMYEVLADKTMWAVCGRTADVISIESSESQSVTLDVMPLLAGYLPLPSVRLSKYIAATATPVKDPLRKVETSSAAQLAPRLEPFSPGQVCHCGKALQVHVLPSVVVASNQTH